MDDSGAFHAWAARAIATRWPGARVDKVAALPGDLSTRRFWRVAIATLAETAAPPSAILVDLGPDDLPRYVRVLDLLPTPIVEPPWINVHRFLESIGAHVDGTARIDHRCVASKIAYSGRLFEWELKEFAEVGLAAVAPGADFSLIAPELTQMTARLDRCPRVFSHRDYHRKNLFIQDGPRIRIIDFQDALMAPAAQDLAVLLTTRDTDEFITPAMEGRLLDFYYTGLIRRAV